MPTMTLDDIAAEIEKRYEPLTIPLGEAGDVELVPALRLPKERRAEVAKLQSQFGELQARGKEPDADQAKLEKDLVALVEQILVKVCKHQPQGKKLVKRVGGDLIVLMEIMRQYSGSSQLGEASASPTS